MKEVPTILIVDDESDIIEFLQYNLEKEGFRVVTANDGKTAIEEAYRVKPNLIILDIMMPEMDGVEVCQQLRTDSVFDHTIISFLTARNEDYSQVAALDIGGDSYITKPIRPRLLISHVKALFRRTERKRDKNLNTVLKVADLVIDKEKVVVLRGEEKFELPKKEFEILVLLTSRPNKAFTREEIFNKVWGNDIIVGTRTIDVHIRRLREKLGSTYIKTLKGIGYKLEV